MAANQIREHNGVAGDQGFRMSVYRKFIAERRLLPDRRTYKAIAEEWNQTYHHMAISDRNVGTALRRMTRANWKDADEASKADMHEQLAELCAMASFNPTEAFTWDENLGNFVVNPSVELSAFEASCFKIVVKRKGGDQEVEMIYDPMAKLKAKDLLVRTFYGTKTSLAITQESDEMLAALDEFEDDDALDRITKGEQTPLAAYMDRTRKMKTELDEIKKELMHLKAQATERTSGG